VDNGRERADRAGAFGQTRPEYSDVALLLVWMLLLLLVEFIFVTLFLIKL